MTKDKAYHILQIILYKIRNPKIKEAIQIAMKALAWESAHKKMLEFIKENDSED